MTLSPRTKFVLMFLLFASPIVASYLMFFFWKPDTTSNFGTLMRPAVNLPAEKFAALDGKDHVADAASTGLRGKWLLVTVDDGTCAQSCRDRLYIMRQSRLILGKDQNRVARVVLVTEDAKPVDATLQEYAGVAWANARNSAWIKEFQKSIGPDAKLADHLFAVDPMGNYFMRYPATADIKQLAADFRRVLKASQLGKEFEGKIESVTKPN